MLAQRHFEKESKRRRHFVRITLITNMKHRLFHPSQRYIAQENNTTHAKSITGRTATSFTLYVAYMPRLLTARV